MARGAVGVDSGYGLWVARSGYRTQTYLRGAEAMDRVVLERECRIVVALSSSNLAPHILELAVERRTTPRDEVPTGDRTLVASDTSRLSRCMLVEGDGAAGFAVEPGVYRIVARSETGAVIVASDDTIVREGESVTIDLRIP